MASMEKDETWDRHISAALQSLEGECHSRLSSKDLPRSAQAIFRSHGFVTGPACSRELQQLVDGVLQSSEYEYSSHPGPNPTTTDTPITPVDTDPVNDDDENVGLQRAIQQSFQRKSDSEHSGAEDVDPEQLGIYRSLEWELDADGEDVHLQEAIRRSLERQLDPGLVCPEDVDLQQETTLFQDLRRFEQEKASPGKDNDCDTLSTKLQSLRKFVDALASAWKDTNWKDTNGNPLWTEILSPENLEPLLETMRTPGKEEEVVENTRSRPDVLAKSLKSAKAVREPSEGRHPRSRGFTIEACFRAAAGALLIAPFDPSGTMLILGIIATAGGLLRVSYQCSKDSKITRFLKQAFGKLKKKKGKKSC